jgi:hypothetical protein
MATLQLFDQAQQYQTSFKLFPSFLRLNICNAPNQNIDVLPADLQSIFKKYEEFWLYGTYFRVPIESSRYMNKIIISNMSSNRSGWATNWLYDPIENVYTKERWCKDHDRDTAIETHRFSSFTHVLEHFIKGCACACMLGVYYKDDIHDCSLALG